MKLASTNFKIIKNIKKEGKIKQEANYFNEKLIHIFIYDFHINLNKMHLKSKIAYFLKQNKIILDRSKKNIFSFSLHRLVRFSLFIVTNKIVLSFLRQNA
jgi:hypothetical protein